MSASPFATSEYPFFRPTWGWGYFAGCLRNLRAFVYALAIRFPRNVWRYRAWLANDVDYDWEFLAEVMIRKLVFMADHFDDHATLRRSHEMAGEMREVARLLHRIRGGDSGLERENEFGYERYDSMTDEEQATFWREVRADEEQDRQRFGALMSRIEWWWD